jgi:hypothetical protein
MKGEGMLHKTIFCVKVRWAEEFTHTVFKFTFYRLTTHMPAAYTTFQMFVFAVVMNKI